MATGALDANGIWQYGEDDSETTFSALLNKLASSASTQLSTGRVVNTVQTTKTNAFTTTSNSFVDVTGMSVAITPKKNTNKVLVTANFIIGITSTGSLPAVKLLRNGTNIGASSAGFIAVPFPQTTGGTWVALSFLDSPATTSATTYKLQVASSESYTLTFGTYASGGGSGVTSLSTITVQEVTA